MPSIPSLACKTTVSPEQPPQPSPFTFASHFLPTTCPQTPARTPRHRASRVESTSPVPSVCLSLHFPAIFQLSNPVHPPPSSRAASAPWIDSRPLFDHTDHRPILAPPEIPDRASRRQRPALPCPSTPRVSARQPPTAALLLCISPSFAHPQPQSRPRPRLPERVSVDPLEAHIGRTIEQHPTTYRLAPLRRDTARTDLVSPWPDPTACFPRRKAIAIPCATHSKIVFQHRSN